MRVVSLVMARGYALAWRRASRWACRPISSGRKGLVNLAAVDGRGDHGRFCVPGAGVEFSVVACARLNSTAKAKYLNPYCAAGLFQ